MTNAIPHVDILQYDMLECVIVRKVNSRETEQQRGLLFFTKKGGRRGASYPWRGQCSKDSLQAGSGGSRGTNV